MHLQSFKYFNQVAESKSISKVATGCHISQSALSQQIQKLEDNLGYTLLTRSNKGVELTEYGRLVHKYAENLIRTYDTMLQELDNLYKNDNIIRFGSCWTMATYALPCALYHMKKKFPNHNYSLISNSSKEVEQNVLNDIYDLGFIHGKPENNFLTSYKLGTEKLVLVASNDFPIPNEISIEALTRYPFIFSTNKQNIKESLNYHLKKFAYSYDDFNVLFVLDSIESVKSTINNGCGISFLPHLAVKRELQLKQLKEIKVSHLEIFYEINLIYKEDKYTNHPIKEFMDYFKKLGKKSFC